MNIAKSLCALKPAKILVLGDLLLDTYTIGKAKRISPEAPVAIVNAQEEKHLPGGAGNVVLNLISLGAKVCIVGRVGNDWAGDKLCQAFQDEGTTLQLIVRQEKYKTPIKNRIIAENQQIVRVDFEQVEGLSEPLEQQIIDSLPTLLEGIQVIALSDYGKGFLTPTLIQAVIQEAKERNLLVITDPKGQDFTKYAGTTLIKPNLSEAYAAANLPAGRPLEQVAEVLFSITQSSLIMITRSEEGITFFESNGKRHDFPVLAKEVKDVTGAGDTVLAMLAFSLANGLPFQEAAHLCNVAASIAIEQVGCARVSLAEMAQQLLKQRKIFHPEDYHLLKGVMPIEKCHALVIPQVSHLSIKLYQVIKTLSVSHPLIVIVTHSCSLVAEMLASLSEVQFVIMEDDLSKEMTFFGENVQGFVFQNEKLQLIENQHEYKCLL